MKNRFTKIIFMSFIIFTVQLFAFQKTGAVSGASGGGGVGALEDVDGANLNPAQIAVFSKKVFAVSASSSHLNIEMIDNGRDALFPAGVTYTKIDENHIRTEAYHLIIAYPLYTSSLPKLNSTQNPSTSELAFGVDVSLREIKLEFLDEKYRQTVVSPGLFYQMTDSVFMGLVWKNKPLSDTDLTDSLDKNSTVALGFSYVYDKFAKTRFDIETADNEKTDFLIYKFGLETFINDWIITRIGYQNDNAHSLNYFTAGLGFAGPQFGLHYAYQSEARKTTDPLHTIDLNISF